MKQNTLRKEPRGVLMHRGLGREGWERRAHRKAQPGMGPDRKCFSWAEGLALESPLFSVLLHYVL